MVNYISIEKIETERKIEHLIEDGKYQDAVEILINSPYCMEIMQGRPNLVSDLTSKLQDNSVL